MKNKPTLQTIFADGRSMVVHFCSPFRTISIFSTISTYNIEEDDTIIFNDEQ